MTEPKKTELVWLEHGQISPSALNPRTYFDPAKINELKSSFAEHGFTAALSHLLVRPIMYRVQPFPDQEVFTVTRKWRGAWTDMGFGYFEEPAQAADYINTLPKHELVCGERRWRAAGALINESRLASQVPAVIEELTDKEVLELQLVENQQRENLSPLEEAEAYRQLLDLRDDAGAPMHTRKTVAEKIGCTERHIGHQLALCTLRGTAAGEALDRGELPARHADVLARLPAGKMRDEITRRVLKPDDGLAPMPFRQLERIVRDECMVELRGADFDPADATLVEVAIDSQTQERKMGGACGDCPFNTKNAEAEEKGSRIYMCMNPECFRLKTTRAHERWAASVTDEAKNRCALPVKEAEKVFDHTGKKLQWNSGYVELSAKPDEGLLKGGVKDVASWKKLLPKQGVPVVLAKDASGKVHELVKTDLAVAAAREAEKEKPGPEKLFKSEAGMKNSESHEHNSKRVLEQQAERERETRITEIQVKAVIEAARTPQGLAETAVPDGRFWRLALEALIQAEDVYGDTSVIAERHGCPAMDADNYTAWLNDHAAKVDFSEQFALLVDLLLNGAMSAGIGDPLSDWAGLCGVDLKAIKKQALKEIANEDKRVAEQEEAKNGLQWKTRQDAVEHFQWDEHNVCLNPDVAEIAFPKSAKIAATVEVARNAKGWHEGFSVQGPAFGNGKTCSATGPNYVSRELAQSAALLAILRELKDAKQPEAIISRAVKLHDETVAPKASPKKKAPKKVKEAVQI